MVGLVYYLTNWLFIGVLSLTNTSILNHRQFLCLFSGEVYLSLGISLSFLIFSIAFITVSELFCSQVLEAFVILLAILLPVISPVASAIFWIALFAVVLSASVADC